MILPDVNIILHAYNSEAPSHLPARKWWENTLRRGNDPLDERDPLS